MDIAHLSAISLMQQTDARRVCAQELAATHQALLSSDAEQGFADAIPGWSALLDALAAAVDGGGGGSAAARAAPPRGRQLATDADAQAGSSLLQGVEAAVEQVLLWGQTVAAAQAAWAAPSAEGAASRDRHTAAFNQLSWPIYIYSKQLAMSHSLQLNFLWCALFDGGHVRQHV